MKKVDILGVLIDSVTMEEAVARAVSCIESEKTGVVYTPNSEIVLQAYKNPEFCEILNSADLIVPDGIGVVHASKIVRAPLPERVAGFDLSCRLLEKAAEKSYSIYFFGGKPGIAEKAIENLKTKHPGLCVAGANDGYFDAEKEKLIIEDIQAKKPDILFVCLGAPKQENWIYRHKDALGAGVILGVGGSLDVWAGTVERAPLAYQKAGLEWLYRLMKQPSRFFRMMALPRFALTVLFKGKRVRTK